MTAQPDDPWRAVDPVLDDVVYTFSSVSERDAARVTSPLGTFREEEGITLICRRDEAEALGFKCEGRFKKISLSIYSSLEAVGLTARVSTALAAAGISCNVIAGFYHDHLFVPADRATDAVQILSKLDEADVHP